MPQPGNEKNDLVAWMEKKGIEVTRENYIDLAYLGETPDDWGPEHEAMLPEELREEA